MQRDELEQRYRFLLAFLIGHGVLTDKRYNNGTWCLRGIYGVDDSGLKGAGRNPEEAIDNAIAAATLDPAAAAKLWSETHEAINDMRIALVHQIDELCDQIERTSSRLDPDEQRCAFGAVDHAKEVAKPYRYNGALQPARVLASAPAAEVQRLRDLAATCYAGLGAECDLPEQWLDVLNAAASGEPFNTDGLLPYTREQPSQDSNPQAQVAGTAADALEAYRQAHGLTQAAMAEQLGTLQGHYSEFVNGRRELPKAAMRSAALLGIPADVLLGLDEHDRLKAQKAAILTREQDKACQACPNRAAPGTAEAAPTDTERLDWLDTQGAPSWGGDYRKWMVLGAGGMSVRQAIDADRARQAQGGAA